MDSQQCPLKETDEHRQMRRIAFVAVVVSTVAVIASVVTLPMLYNYVQSFQSHLMVETDYCKARARDMWLEMTALQIVRMRTLQEEGRPAVRLREAPQRPLPRPSVLCPLAPPPLCLPVRLNRPVDNTDKQPPGTSLSKLPRHLQSAALVTRARLEQLDRKEPPDRMVKMVTMERTEPPEGTRSQSPPHLKSLASFARLDQLALKDPLGPKDPRDRREVPENRRRMECRENRECRVSQDRSGAPAVRAPGEHPANPDDLFLFLDHKDLLGLPALLENRDPKDSADLTDNPLKVLPDLQEMLAAPVERDVPEDQDPLDLQAKMVRKEAAITVPSRAPRRDTLSRQAKVAVITIEHGLRGVFPLHFDQRPTTTYSSFILFSVHP
uniref:Nematode cuticle collagen N-terminal domain-containing protein n=1 Tax=Globodera rostochiensis TaxID=31243 RepID=A0A914GTX0_GLORO